MSEIKSTLDLIMEKTRHLSMNQEEKESVKKQELARKVRGIISLFLSEERDATYLDHQMKLLAEDDKNEGNKICKNLLIERIHSFEDNQRVLAGVEKLLGENERDRWEGIIEKLKTPLMAESEKTRLESESHFREILAAEGLRGPAILPRPEKDPLLKEEKERVAKAFEQALRTEI